MVGSLQCLHDEVNQIKNFQCPNTARAALLRLLETIIEREEGEYRYLDANHKCVDTSRNAAAEECPSSTPNSFSSSSCSADLAAPGVAVVAKTFLLNQLACFELRHDRPEDALRYLQQVLDIEGKKSGRAAAERSKTADDDAVEEGRAASSISKAAYEEKASSALTDTNMEDCNETTENDDLFANDLKTSEIRRQKTMYAYDGDGGRHGSSRSGCGSGSGSGATATTLTNLSVVYLRLGQSDKAVMCARDAVLRCPPHIVRKNDDDDDSNADDMDARDNNVSSTSDSNRINLRISALYNLGVILLRNGNRYSEALEATEEAIQLTLFPLSAEKTVANGYERASSESSSSWGLRLKDLKKSIREAEKSHVRARILEHEWHVRESTTLNQHVKQQFCLQQHQHRNRPSSRARQQQQQQQQPQLSRRQRPNTASLARAANVYGGISNSHTSYGNRSNVPSAALRAPPRSAPCSSSTGAAYKTAVVTRSNKYPAVVYSSQQQRPPSACM